MQGTQLMYAIKFVADMDKAVKFYCDVVGLTLKFPFMSARTRPLVFFARRPTAERAADAWS